MSTLLEVNDLCISATRGPRQNTPVLQKVSLSVPRGEIVAIVGESGCGKTMLARAILGLLPPPMGIRQGSIVFEERELIGRSSEEMRAVRGARIGMIFQEPLTALNPALAIGRQLAEVLESHTQLPRSQIRKRTIEMLDRVGLPAAAQALGRAPFEFSGGMRQRIMIASALLMQPPLLIADEPTTALDCIIQKQILELLTRSVIELGSSLLLISHDLGMVAQYARRVIVMQNGCILEQGPTQEILLHPRHPYTKKLLAALPSTGGAPPPPAPAGAPLASVRDLAVEYRHTGTSAWLRRPRARRALDGVSLDILRGETLGVVGESGSGKTTLGRALLSLVTPSQGTIHLDGRSLTGPARPTFRALSGVVRLVFQDPYSSLSPRLRVRDIIAEPLRMEGSIPAAQRSARVAQALADVGLGPEFAERYPNELSGGQRQRVSIASALIRNPALIVADEPVSALDVTVQAQVLRLFERLKRLHGFTLVLISHDLSVVESIADRVAVLQRGKIVELDTCARIFHSPAHPYTRELLAALPCVRPAPGGGYSLVNRAFVTP